MMLVIPDSDAGCLQASSNGIPKSIANSADSDCKTTVYYVITVASASITNQHNNK